MIQRIQTLFLLVAAGLLGALLAVPLIGVEEAGAYSANSVFADQLLSLEDHIGMIILFLVAAAAALISIFLFKNRKVQSRLTIMATIISLGGIGFVAYLLFQEGVFETGDLVFKAGISFPVLAIIFLLLANRAIKKDEKLVKSSYSRLR